MRDLRRFFASSIARKLLNGLTGLLLMVFIVAHLGGNLTLLIGADAFNAYAFGLHEMGMVLYFAEIGLLIVFVAHAISGISVWLDKRRARTVNNSMRQSKGPPSRQTFSSRSMVLTGILLLAFVIVHVMEFRFGPSIEEGYVTTLHGKEVRDLYRLVVEEFKEPFHVVLYMVVMVVLGFHLRHGFWSAFQSLGVLDPKLRPVAYAFGAGFAFLVALGFFILPLYLYFFAAVPASSGFAFGGQP